MVASAPSPGAPAGVFTLQPVLDRLMSADFWLGAPLKIVTIFAVALIANLLARTVIRKVTDGVAAGTRARIVAKRTETGEKRWVEDSAASNERQAQRAETVGSVLRSVATIVIWAIALLMIVSEMGFNIAPVIASAGIAGVALSFGAQSLVKDYLSGISMVAEDQLGIGDSVDLGEATGVVENVGLRVTQVRDVNGTLWHVRNGSIVRVGNSSQGWARTVLDIPVPYTADLREVTDLLLKTAEQVRRDTDIGRSMIGEPEVWGLEHMTGEALTVRLAVKTAPAQQWGVARVLRARLKEAMDAHGFRMPLLNQSVVHRTQSMPIVPPSETRAGSGTGDGQKP